MMTTKSYLGVTIHFIHSSELCSAALGIFELSKSHSANYISHELLNVLNLWNIPKSKILAIVTDNDSTMLKAIKDNFGENKHLRCFVHSINLVAEGSMKNVDDLLDLINKVQNIVKFIKRSVNCSDELRKLQGKDGDNKKRIILDVVTRWNSVYYMCKWFLELKVVNQIVLKHVSAPPMLNDQEIENIKQVVNILEILEKVKSEISGQKYATMSLVIPIISCIYDNLSIMLPTSRIGVEFKNALTDEMKKRFEFIEHNYLLSVSTILNPRFKNIHFKEALALSKHLRFINNSINSVVSLTIVDHHSTDSPDSASKYGTTDLWGHHKHLAKKSLKIIVDKTNLRNQKHLGPEITMYLSTPLSQLKTDPLIC